MKNMDGVDEVDEVDEFILNSDFLTLHPSPFTIPTTLSSSASRGGLRFRARRPGG